MTDPQITTVDCDYKMLVDVVVKVVIERVQEGDFSVRPSMKISESCGCTCVSNLNILNGLNKLNSRFYRYYDDNRILAQIAESMQLCQRLEDVSDKMKNRVMGHMCCVLNKWCFDMSINPIVGEKTEIFEKKYLLYDAKRTGSYEVEEFDVRNIVPRLSLLLKQGAPLIFAEINYMNVSFGYACFFYKGCDQTDYMMIPHVVAALNSGIGGLLNRLHQNYLTKQIEHNYKHDSLTGLYNRLGFINECEKVLNRVKEKNTMVTVVMADLDGLKKINDEYGHTAGDKAIRIVALALKNGCPKDALCVRFGGDEMLVIMEGMYEEKDIRDRICAFLEE